jgi:hypothetical protein
MKKLGFWRDSRARTCRHPRLEVPAPRARNSQNQILAEGDEVNRCLLVSVSYGTSIDVFLSYLLTTLRASNYLNLNCGTSSKMAFLRHLQGAERCGEVPAL